MTAIQGTVARDRRQRRHRPGDRARARRARRASCVLTGRRADVLEPLAQELGGRALARRPRRPRRGRRGSPSEAGEVEILVANAALPGRRHARRLHARADRPRARRQPARADRARASCCRRADGRARPRPPRLHLLAVGQSGRRAAARSTRRRSSACAASRCRCARTCAPPASASRRSSPASSATPACSRDAGVELPPGVGTRTPRGRRGRGRARDRAQQGRGRRRAARPARRRDLLAGLAPELSASNSSRRMGGARIADGLAAGGRDHR